MSFAAEGTPRRVLFVHSGAERFGSDTSLLLLASGLDRRQYMPMVVLPHSGPLLDSLRGAGVAAKVMDLTVLRRKFLCPGGAIRCFNGLLPSALCLASEARAGGYALIHSNTSAVLTGALAARLAGIPHVWHVREIVTSPNWVANALAMAVGFLSDRVLAISNGVCTHLMSTWSRMGKSGWGRKVEVVPNGVDLSSFGQAGSGSAFRNVLGIPAEAKLVGIVGGINRWKGQDIFLEVAAKLAPAFQDTRFVVVGGAYSGNEPIEQQLRRKAVDLGIADVALFAGERRDIAEVMEAMDVLVLASTSPEPFGRVLIEAMAAGKPVVATAAGGPLDIVADGETGFLVPPHDSGSMARAVAVLLGDGSIARQMGTAGRKRVLEHFSLEAHIANVQRAYEGVLNSKRSLAGA